MAELLGVRFYGNLWLIGLGYSSQLDHVVKSFGNMPWNNFLCFGNGSAIKLYPQQKWMIQPTTPISAILAFKCIQIYDQNIMFQAYSYKSLLIIIQQKLHLRAVGFVNLLLSLNEFCWNILLLLRNKIFWFELKERFSAFSFSNKKKCYPTLLIHEWLYKNYLISSDFFHFWSIAFELNKSK